LALSFADDFKKALAIMRGLFVCGAGLHKAGASCQKAAGQACMMFDPSCAL